MTDTLSLNAIGILCGTDKSSVLQDYLRHYERAFADLRHDPINVIEIGVAQGASLAMLARWFTRAVIVGIDNNPDRLRFDTPRTPVRIGSQDDAAFLRAVAEEFPPTIVIDDGSHRADHNRITFEVLFPLVLPGGRYVIEDLYVHSGASAPHFRGEANGPPTTFINDLSAKIMLRDSGFGEPALKALADQTERMEILRGAVVFFKQAERASPWVESWDHAIEANLASNWFHLAATIAATRGPAEKALEAARRAAALAPDDLEIGVRLAWMLNWAGHLQEAVAEAQMLLAREERGPRFDSFEPRLSRLARGTTGEVR